MEDQCVNESGEDLADCIRFADDSLYQNKNNAIIAEAGKGCDAVTTTLATTTTTTKATTTTQATTTTKATTTTTPIVTSSTPAGTQTLTKLFLCC